ncbi:hypothetical protein RA29_12885 [Tateyamaria sp. ANG-S1]|nr:hypothetical protein RA29_12885 [Tateyamaria sp. ANG-S1]
MRSGHHSYLAEDFRGFSPIAPDAPVCSDFFDTWWSESAHKADFRSFAQALDIDSEFHRALWFAKGEFV